MSKGFIKKAWNSVSGWERSHFGGFKRMVYDYPYVSVDHKANIDTPNGLARNLGSVFNAEKLIKIYLMKAKKHEAAMATLLREKVSITESVDPFTRRPIKTQRMTLDHEGVFEYLLNHEPEFAPLFEEYRKEIFSSYIETELPEGQEGEGQGEGEGDGDGEGQGEGQGDAKPKNGDGEGEGEGPTTKSYGGWGAGKKSLQEVLDAMKEFKPFSASKIGEEVPIRWLSKPRYGRSEGYTTEREFTTEEKINGDRLVKMLDISFEPKSDIVRSLRAGRLDTSKIAEVPAGNTAIYRQTLEDQDTKPFAVCILADMSGSMDGAKLHAQYHVLNSLYYGLHQIIPPDDLYIYAHTGDDEADIYTLCSPHNPEYEKNIGMYYDIDTECNYDGTVIEEVHKKIRNITDNPVIMITLSDGQPCDSEEAMKKILEKARRDQFVTMGVGIKAPYVSKLYTYHCVVEELDTFISDVSQLINKVVRTEFK
jgi:hypothetical protein